MLEGCYSYSFYAGQVKKKEQKKEMFLISFMMLGLLLRPLCCARSQLWLEIQQSRKYCHLYDEGFSRKVRRKKEETQHSQG